MADFSISDPQAIAAAGERIYEQKYKEKYEKTSLGKFLAIDVNSESAYVGDQAEEAFQKAQIAGSKGPFHLVKIGATGAFKISHCSPNAHRSGIPGFNRHALS